VARITINGVSVDPLEDSDRLQAAGLASEDASHSDHILIQSFEPLTPEQQVELAGAGVVIHEYVSPNTYLCGYKDADLAAIRERPYVAWADVYLRQFKIASTLRPPAPSARRELLPMTGAPSHRTTPHTVDIVFHEDADTGSDTLRSAVAAAARVGAETLPMGRRKVRLTVQERYLHDLAAIDDVRLIEEVSPVSLHNNVARSIIDANVVVNGTTYRGDGQVVAVADTGFDTGSTSSPHPAFTGRVARLYDLGRSGKFDDPDGHGTHVCGSVLADGNSPKMGGPIQGTAPAARLVVQSLIDAAGDLGGLPTDLTDLFEPPHRDDGARVHSNSWGSSIAGLPYSQHAREIDEFVWNHPDMVICFSAGNDGVDADNNGSVDPSEIGSEAAAKNCITVGASESQREFRGTYGNLLPGAFSAAPIRDDPIADHPEGMAAFSSRGPTQEGRFKPDLVAPGTCILSAHSRNAPAAPATFGSSKDPDYFFDTGTSMATPLVAGCAAVLRETLVKNGMSDPPASLIKALLINGAVLLAGQYTPSEAGPSPNNNSGWGRVDLVGSVILPGPDPDAGFGTGGPLNQGDRDTFTVDIPADHPRRRAVPSGADTTAAPPVRTHSSGATFKITLVWTDPPGPDLQNDLDLVVIAADGTERHGNAGTTTGFDRANNVEQVLWTNMPPGKATISVSAFRIARFAQPYSYAWRLS
jgi:hypothetical protein